MSAMAPSGAHGRAAAPSAAAAPAYNHYDSSLDYDDGTAGGGVGAGGGQGGGAGGPGGVQAPVGKLRAQRAIEAGQEVTGEEPFNFFMTLFYPADNLMCLDYNRVLKSLNEMAPEEFMAALEENFTLRPLADGETSRV